jgi:hypothetical protein
MASQNEIARLAQAHACAAANALHDARQEAQLGEGSAATYAAIKEYTARAARRALLLVNALEQLNAAVADPGEEDRVLARLRAKAPRVA